ncbi:MAG: cyclopropane fatty acyl phospholipid synthase, partial [Desulfohalobiaceae bacterium]
DIQVHDDKLFQRVLAGGSLAFGESYMDGWWDCERLDQLFERILGAGLERKVRSRTWLLQALKARLLNLQKPSRAFTIGERHYDLGNDLYQTMLDELMLYSCGYWEDGCTLDQAQRNKLDLACRKLGLEPGMRLLDIGCGWGGTAKYAAATYQAEVVGVTVSREQARFARELCSGLPVDIRLQDYREVDETFDRVVSIGMFEHVGAKNYRTFMRKVRSCLPDDGLFLLHTIGGNRSCTSCDPWISTYIFPNSMLPSARQITSAAEGLFVLEDWHSFGPHYDTTLMHWFENFEAGWDGLKHNYDQRFYRMWKYYLLSCAGSFRARSNQLWQVVLSPRGLPGGFEKARYHTA